MTLPQAILSLEESYNRIAARMGGTQFKYERVAVGGIARLEALAEAFATLTGASAPPATRIEAPVGRPTPTASAATRANVNAAATAEEDAALAQYQKLTAARAKDTHEFYEKNRRKILNASRRASKP